MRLGVQWLALLDRGQPRELVGVGLDQVGHAVAQVGPLLGRPVAVLVEGGAGGVDGLVHLGGRGNGQVDQVLAGDGGVDGDDVIGVTVDVGTGEEELGVMRGHGDLRVDSGDDRFSRRSWRVGGLTANWCAGGSNVESTEPLNERSVNG